MIVSDADHGVFMSSNVYVADGFKIRASCLELNDTGVVSKTIQWDNATSGFGGNLK